VTGDHPPREVTGHLPSRPATGFVFEHVTLDVGGRTVLEVDDLRLAPGVAAGVTGPSGSGKSLLCLVVAGVVVPTTGRVTFDGRPYGPSWARWRRSPLDGPGPPAVGLVLQDHGLVAGLTAAENVGLPLQARHVPPDEVGDRCRRALDQVGLAGVGDRFVDDLSGGERQRVGIARAVAVDPVILVADEPTSELDPDNRERVLELILAPSSPWRVAVVASDDPEVIGRLAPVIALDGGKVIGPLAPPPDPPPAPPRAGDGPAASGARQ
jgi:ABC-type lipoprotein export system ATPase subunit